jgi:dolichol kinase
VAPRNIPYAQEALRKATHFIALLIPISYLILTKKEAVIFMAVAWGGIVAFEVIRLGRYWPWQLLRKFVGRMIRPKERHDNFTGAFYILLSGLLSIALFPEFIAFTAMTFQILGDVASAMIGRRFGKHRIRGQKSLEGALGFLVVALLVTVIVPKVPYTVGIVGAIVAAAVEAISIYRDDNLTVPDKANSLTPLLITTRHQSLQPAAFPVVNFLDLKLTF